MTIYPRALVLLALLMAALLTPASAQVNAGECDSAVRVVTVAMGIGIVAVGRDKETQRTALGLPKDMEVVLERSCGLTPEQARIFVQSLRRDIASNLSDTTGNNVETVPGHDPTALIHFTEDVLKTLFERCRADKPPMSGKECFGYIRGIADGQCMARYPLAAESRACSSERYREISEGIKRLSSSNYRVP